MTAPPVVVVMGVSGSGKTTVGKRLAERLRVPFAEGDEFHPRANIEKMSRGAPLTDADRWPWLASIARRIDAARRDRRGLVIACSALKRAYRDVLIGGRPDVRRAYLKGSRAVIGARIGKRSGHYMPASLLPSQFAALEEPAADERPIVADVTKPPDAIAGELAEAIVRA
ncbi:MAG: gluconokinase [Alphaproteobacteria bacterium]|nr:gluconokinase [Alphaproteobacteria bacterium]